MDTELVLMTATEARNITDRIKNNLSEVRHLLLDMYEREGWRALGYESWRDYGHVEFGYSESYVYRLMDAAKIERNISPIGEKAGIIPESHLRPLAKLEPEEQREVYKKVTDIAPAGRITAAQISRAADEYKSPSPASAGPPPANIGDEYYTPKHIIDSARAVLGEVDLDPASCATANRVVGASIFFSKLNNGLIKPWLGRVWLNPPFSFPKPFIDRLLAEYAAGRTTAAIVLVNNGTETSWGQALLSRFPVCFASTRISFWHETPDQPLIGNRYAQMIFYLGDKGDLFSKEFSQYGAILEAR